MSKAYCLPCKIERGGFASERLFTVETLKGPVAGISYVIHLLDEHFRTIEECEPEGGCNGYTLFREIRDGDNGTVLVEVPSGDILFVKRESFCEIPQEIVDALDAAY